MKDAGPWGKSRVLLWLDYQQRDPGACGKFIKHNDLIAMWKILIKHLNRHKQLTFYLTAVYFDLRCGQIYCSSANLHRRNSVISIA